MKEFTLQVDYKICGIVLVGGNNLIARDIEFFEKMLICDMFRGEHSTGVMAGFKPNATTDLFVNVAKAAIPGDVFVRSKLWEEIKSHSTTTQSAYNKTTYITTKTNPKFLVGHNRYATQGAVNDTNAHPFTHGHITLCHNGTLTDQTLLPEHKNFAVDSENVAYAISVWGIDRTIQNLDGAFTLVWHDANLQTVNVIRNSERPFHLVETTTGDWFGASEEDMIMWILTRKKYSPAIKRHFECEEGVQYVFDVSSGFKLKEEIKHELPKFTYKWSNYSTTYYDRSYNTYDYGSKKNETSAIASKVEDTAKARQENILAEAGFPMLKVGKEVDFCSMSMDKYAGTSATMGKMCGWIATSDGYLEVQAHSFPVSNYEVNKTYRGIISYVFINGANQVPTITVRAARLLPSGSKTELVVIEPKQADEDVYFTELMSGEKFTKEEWNERRDDQVVCCVCSNPVTFETSGEAVLDQEGHLYCDTDCFDAMYNDGNVADFEDEPSFGNHAKMEKAPPPALPKCQLCDTTMTPLNVSEKEDVCKDCYDHYYTRSKTVVEEEELNAAPIFRKKINGMFITNSQWNKMNECKICKTRIPWGLAERTMFLFNAPVCDWCKSKVKG